MKDRIVLKDGTVLEIEQSSNSGEFTMSFSGLAEFAETLQKLSQDNLSEYQVQNQEELTVARPVNKECLHVSAGLTWDKAGAVSGVSATFDITDVDMIRKRLDAMEAGQEVQDGAILELAGLAGGES